MLKDCMTVRLLKDCMTVQAVRDGEGRGGEAVRDALLPARPPRQGRGQVHEVRLGRQGVPHTANQDLHRRHQRRAPARLTG
eukprot:4380143-Pyramimonas_sp.AAC.1